MNWRLAAVALAVAVPTSALALPQSGNEGSIEGLVIDVTRAVVPGATVEVRHQETAAIYTAVADRRGSFRFLVVPVGTYDVRADHPGFATFRRLGVLVTVGAKVSVPIVLEVGTREESVSVSGAPVLAEPTRTSLSATIDRHSIASLPLNGRNFVNFVLLAPGFTGGGGGGFTVAGQNSMNSLLVDGNDQNGFGAGPVGTAMANRYLFSQESVQELQVNTASYSSEFGRAGTGVINVITKSGTNRWQGTAFWYYRDDALSATGPIEKLRGEPRTPFDGHQFGATLGGPIVRNRLFFYASYDGQRRNEENLTVLNLPSDFAFSADPEVAGFQKAGIKYLSDRAGRYAQRFEQNVALVKVDWHLATNHVVRGSWNRHRFDFTNTASAGPQQSLEHSGTVWQFADSVTVSFTSILGPRSVNVARFGYVGNHDPQGANTYLPEAIVNERGSTVLSVGRAARLPVDTGVWRTEWADTLSLNRGAHALKIGGNVLAENGRWYSGVNFYGAYLFGSLESFGRSLAGQPAMASRYQQAFSAAGTPPIDVRPFCLDVGAFAQDSWRLGSRLSVDLGLRYEVQAMRQSPVRNPSQALAAAGIDTSYVPTDANNVAPRFGAAWNVGGTGRLVVRGGYGWYFPRLLPATVARVFAQNGMTAQTRDFTNDNIPAYPNTACGPPDASGAVPTCAPPAGKDTIMAASRNYRQAVIRQGSVGAEYALGMNLSVSATYLRVAGEALLHWQDINLFEPELSSITVVGAGNASYRHYSSVHPIDAYKRIFLLTSNGRSRYDGLVLSVDKRFSHRCQLTASYTLGRAVDDNPTLGALNPGPGDGELLSDSLRPALDTGPSDAGERHRMVASGTWSVPDAGSLPRTARALLGGWEISGVLAVDSGRPYTGLVKSDLNGDGNSSTDRAPGVGRNTFVLPATAAVDLRLTRRLPVTRRLRLDVRCDTFNLFNRANFSSVKTTQYASSTCEGIGPCLVPRSDFGTPTAALNARSVQLSARLAF